MPPLSKTLRGESPEGFAAMEKMPASVPTPPEPGRVLGANPYIRCPLPPFNATSDTLRQFNENGKIPARRVIPLPASVNASGNVTQVTNTTVNSSSGGSSGGNVPIVVAAKTVSFSSPTLLPGEATVLQVTASEMAVLMILGASDFCEVRVYGDSTAQAADVARDTDTAPAFEITQGLVTDIVLDTNPLQYNWQNRVFVNQDVPQKPIFYVTVLNPTSGAVTPSITITYLPLE